jgi:hypothetical protein
MKTEQLTMKTRSSCTQPTDLAFLQDFIVQSLLFSVHCSVLQHFVRSVVNAIGGAPLPAEFPLPSVNSSRSSKPEAERTCGEMVEKLPYEKGEAAKEVRPGFFDSGAVSAPGVFP